MFFNDYTQGDTGSGVSNLQQYLVEVGYPLTVDGQFGPRTASAIAHFQASRGVSGDARGVAGPATLIALATARGAGWKQSGYVYTPVSGGGAPAEAPSAPMQLPFGLTPLKVGLLGAIGVVAWFAAPKR